MANKSRLTANLVSSTGISTFSRVTVSPRQKTSSGDSLILSTTDSSNKMELLFTQSEANYYRIQSVDQGVAYTPLSLQNDGGNLGIGTTNPGFKVMYLLMVIMNSDSEFLTQTAELLQLQCIDWGMI